MNDTRKKIILQEIQHWKQNRMLPEHYCDFLLALYSEGEGPQAAPLAKDRLRYIYTCSAVALVIIISVVLNYFTQLPALMQMAVYCFFIIVLFLIAKGFSVKKLPVDIPLIGAAFLLLLTTVETAEQLAPQKNGILYTILLIHCLLWITIGKRFSKVYFTVAGIMGIAVGFFFIVKLYSIF
ncbi:hypothetical protein [Peribacillus sp. SCS-155]|uniref:hypothetical protein n=1 Tax=Peribacillus sedimenti TaxID=3115297 RepID=UPI003906268E